MKFNGSLLLIAAMVVGSIGAVGCKGNNDKISDKGNEAAQQESATPTPEDNPETAPVSEENESAHNSPATIEKDALVVSYWSYRAPPALRVEERGVAPGAGYWWRSGYYGWRNSDYYWYPGRWYGPRAGYTYYSPYWHHWGNRWGYRPGRWYRHY